MRIMNSIKNITLSKVSTLSVCKRKMYLSTYIYMNIA